MSSKAAAKAQKKAEKAQMKLALKGTSRCYFDLGIDGKLAGRVVFELFGNICPKTTENFRMLCTGELGETLSYRGVKIHRVIPNFMLQGGDISAGTGSGPPQSIYGGMWPDENFVLQHDKPFLLSMANRGPDTNGSQFFITTTAAPHLDGKHVVFGRVVAGEAVVKQIEAVETDRSDRPFDTVTVMKCGELIRRSAGDANATGKRHQEGRRQEKRGTGSGSDSKADSDSDDSRQERKKSKKHKKEKSKKKKKKSKRRKHKRRASSSESESNSASDSETGRSGSDSNSDTNSDTRVDRHRKRHKSKRSHRKSKRSRSSSASDQSGSDHNNAGSDVDGTNSSEKGKAKKDEKDSGDTTVRLSNTGKLLRGRGSFRARSPMRGPTYAMGKGRRDPNRDRYMHGARFDRRGMGGEQRHNYRDRDATENRRRGRDRHSRGRSRSDSRSRGRSRSRSGGRTRRYRNNYSSSDSGSSSDEADRRETLSSQIQARLDKQRAARRQKEDAEKQRGAIHHTDDSVEPGEISDGKPSHESRNEQHAADTSQPNDDIGVGPITFTAGEHLDVEVGEENDPMDSDGGEKPTEGATVTMRINSEDAEKKQELSEERSSADKIANEPATTLPKSRSRSRSDSRSGAVSAVDTIRRDTTPRSSRSRDRSRGHSSDRSRSRSHESGRRYSRSHGRRYMHASSGDSHRRKGRGRSSRRSRSRSGSSHNSRDKRGRASRTRARSRSRSRSDSGSRSESSNRQSATRNRRYSGRHGRSRSRSSSRSSTGSNSD